MKYLNDFIDFLFPSFCTGCDEKLLLGEEYLCFECLSDLPRTGFFNMPDQTVSRLFFGRLHLAYAASWLHFDQGNITQNMTHQLKYGRDAELGVYLGQLMGDDLLASTCFPKPDLIIPVPITKAKLRLRGYNQAESLARGIAQKFGAEVGKEVLIRKGRSKSQTKKGRADRYLNVENAFEVKNQPESDMENILLVDDVLTTGATAEACMRKLRGHSDASLSLVTLAYAD